MVAVRLPPVTKYFMLAVTLLSLYSTFYRLWSKSDNPSSNSDPYYLVLVIGRTPWWAFWTLATTTLVEVQFIPMAIVLIVVASGGRYCEKVWTSASYFRFMAIILVATTFLETIVWSYFAELPLLVCGANSLLAGIVVALKQMVPSHTIILLRNRIRLQIRWLPLSFLVLVSLLQLWGLENNVFAYYMGFLGSWFFLRYHHETDTIGYGDASDAFSFANFFPSPISRWIETPLDKIYYLLSTKLGVIRCFTQEEIDSANQRYAARLAGTLLPKYTHGPRLTNQRRNIMLQALDRNL